MLLNRFICIKNFKPSEFACPCGCEPLALSLAKPSKQSDYIEYSIPVQLLRALQHLRNKTQQAISITSGYRCQKHNSTLNNASANSSHLKGLAVDFTVKDLDKHRIAIISELHRLGINRIGIGKHFIHIDIDTKKPQVSWTY